MSVQSRPTALLDLETFSNWFLFGLTDFQSEATWDYQLVPGGQLPIDAMVALLQHYQIITFNGQHYDVPMLAIALSGADNDVLKWANDAIIVRKVPHWTVLKQLGVRVPGYIDHIDVKEVAPGVHLSLKQYAGRIHAPNMVETAVDFNVPLPADKVNEEIYYCQNDRIVTKLLTQKLTERMELRRRVTQKYGTDVRSKSDAQIAEAVFKAEMTRIINDSEALFAEHQAQGFSAAYYPHQHASYSRDGWGNIKINVPHINHGYTFKPRIPQYVEFVTPQMQEFLAMVRNLDFMVSDKDEAELLGLGGENIKTGVIIPAELKGRDICIGQSVYRVGIGGLHSQESSVRYTSIPFVQTLQTADVASYYPSMILKAAMNPPQLGPSFTMIYKTIYDDRISAKAAVKKLKKLGLEEGEDFKIEKANEGGFKIVLNGTFGKLFSRFSIFYAPEFGIAVTIGGQLSLLMLIERLELMGIRVVSANTDGIEMLVPYGREGMAASCIKWWEEITGLVMETKNYLSLNARDVNNYVSVEFDGSTKRKGVFKPSGIDDNKHPDCDICADAVVEFLAKGTPIVDTIMGCKDIRKFVRIRGVKGGGVYMPEGTSMFLMGTNEKGKAIKTGIVGGQQLAKTVRWYYGKSKGCIVDGSSLNQVSASEYATPCLSLPNEFPTDINLQWYVDTANEMLENAGYGVPA